jgi:hypothetical protein
MTPSIGLSAMECTNRRRCIDVGQQELRAVNSGKINLIA